MRAFRILAVLTIFVTSGCANPRAEANVAQALNDAANEISGLKNDVAQLQTEVDSLRGLVATHDTLLTRLSATLPR